MVVATDVAQFGRAVVSKTKGWEFDSLHPCFFYFMMLQLINFVKSSYNEFRKKVVWKSYEKIQELTIMFFVGLTVFSLALAGINILLDQAVAWCYVNFIV